MMTCACARSSLYRNRDPEEATLEDPASILTETRHRHFRHQHPSLTTVDVEPVILLDQCHPSDPIRPLTVAGFESKAFQVVHVASGLKSWTTSESRDGAIREGAASAQHQLPLLEGSSPNSNNSIRGRPCIRVTSVDGLEQNFNSSRHQDPQDLESYVVLLTRCGAKRISSAPSSSLTGMSI